MVNDCSNWRDIISIPGCIKCSFSCSKQFVFSSTTRTYTEIRTAEVRNLIWPPSISVGTQGLFKIITIFPIIEVKSLKLYNYHLFLNLKLAVYHILKSRCITTTLCHSSTGVYKRSMKISLPHFRICFK